MFVIGTTLLITVSIFYYYQNRSITIAHAQRSGGENVKELAYHLEEQMTKDTQLTHTIASAAIIAESLTLSNSDFASLSVEERGLEISRLNKKWMGTKDINDPFIQTYMSNPVASYLLKQQKCFLSFLEKYF